MRAANELIAFVASTIFVTLYGVGGVVVGSFLLLRSVPPCLRSHLNRSTLTQPLLRRAKQLRATPAAKCGAFLAAISTLEQINQV